ncbi:hypothetical protein ACQ4WX_01840 [Streptomyces lasalocidi]
MRSVDVRTKRGLHHNELTRYRYEAVLSTAEPVADLAAAPVLRWGRDIAGIADVLHRLTTARPAALRLAAVPNRRVQDEYAAMQSLFDPRESIDLGPQDAFAPDPEVLCETAERLGYRALPTWGESPELLDIVLLDPERMPAGALTGVYAARVSRPRAPRRHPDRADGPGRPAAERRRHGGPHGPARARVRRRPTRHPARHADPGDRP